MSQKLLPLATRVLTGEASRAEQDRLNTWLEDPKHRVWFEQLQRRWRAAAPELVGGFNASEAARRLAALITRSGKTPTQHSKIAKARKS